MDSLRQVSNDFFAGLLSTDGQLSFEAATQDCRDRTAPRVPRTQDTRSIAAQAVFPRTRRAQYQVLWRRPQIAENRRTPRLRLSCASGGVNPALAELLTPKFLMECTPSQVAAIKPLYQRYARHQDEPEPTDEDKRRENSLLCFQRYSRSLALVRCREHQSPRSMRGNR